ncbi:type II secretion system protein N [Pantoea sp. 1.19]|uniref:type II secretion system protein N n=1 Tax=Pantoea sp. 1.19 TaxID=1925589 RepID=UPI000948CB07|nr:type II secretion system protein N [Pantoea sp. 1.19]
MLYRLAAIMLTALLMARVALACVAAIGERPALLTARPAATGTPSPVAPLPLTLFDVTGRDWLYDTEWLAPDDRRIVDAPRSRLPLTLTGIVLSSHPRRSLAIVAQGAQQFSLQEQDALPSGGATVVRIFADRVIIAHQGRYESLIMEPG